MPKGRPRRSKKQKADNAIAAENLTSAAQPDKLHRPNTRAWSKQEEKRKRNNVHQGSGPPVLPAAQLQRRTRGRRRSKGPEATRGQTRTARLVAAVDRLESSHDLNSAKPSKSKKGKQSHQPIQLRTSCQATRLTGSRSAKPRDGKGRFTKKAAVAKGQPELNQHPETTATKEPRQIGKRARPEATALDDWFRQIEAVSPERAQQPQILQGLNDSMNSSSASRNEDGESTARPAGSKSSTTLETKLRTRRVQRTATPDERLPHLKRILKTELPKRRLKDTQALQTAAQDFLDLTIAYPDASCYSYIDDFSFNIDQCKSAFGYPIVNHRYFQADLKRCLARNEAILQRTIMIHIINQYWLDEIFDWNTEGQWSLPKDNRLPSRKDDDISLPRPDLAISFTLKSFTGDEDDSDPIPTDLERCISPDAGNRCFPFLFMEVKKAAADLQDAEMANLHSASQALYNMYTWMVRAGQEEAFFDHVRVFSLVFNAQDLSVRVHRVLQQPDGNLSFRFDEFHAAARYTKDSACLLIESILTDYAARELHPALKTAFAEIIRQEDLRVLNKRKANAVRSASTKKLRRSQDSASNLRTGQTFSMGNLSAGDIS